LLTLRRTAVLPERSRTACAVAAHDGRVLLAWTGTDRHLNTMSSRDGQTFGDKATLPFISRTLRNEAGPGHLSPALAGRGDGFHLAWAGRSGRLHHHLAGTSGTTDLGGRTSHPPAIAARAGEVVIAWTGTDVHLNLVRRQDGVWGPSQRLDERSPHSPALCASDLGLALAWTGTDHRVNVLLPRDGDRGWVRLAQATSAFAPALCARGDGLVVAWTGRDRRIRLLTLGPDGPGETQQLPATAMTLGSPALCTHGESVVVTWTSWRHRLCVGLAV
jgi:hypothetical protein